MSAGCNAGPIVREWLQCDSYADYVTMWPIGLRLICYIPVDLFVSFFYAEEPTKVEGKCIVYYLI